MYADTYKFHNQTFKFKPGRWGGALIKGEGHECDFDWKIILHGDLLKLCLNQKHNIIKSFPDIIVYLDDKKLFYEVMG